MKEFKGIWIPYEILVDKDLNDKEKMIYSMLIYLSKENECVMSNTYISNLLNICNVQASRIVNSLKKKGYIKIEIVYKKESKEIALRKIMPINKYVNTTQKVLVESVNDHDDALVTGRMTNNTLVHFPGSSELIGKIVNVRLIEGKGFYYFGEQIAD